MTIPPGWTDERVAELTRLWALGWSASQIAKSLGGITRNAVIGKGTRMGLPGRSADAIAQAVRIGARQRGERALPPQNSKPRKPKNNSANLSGLNALLRSPPRPLPVSTRIELEPTATLDALNAHTCKWPIGDPQSPDFGFCGRLKSLETPYCTYHAKVAFAPARPEKTKAYVTRRAA